MAENRLKDLSGSSAKRYNAIKNFLFVAETFLLVAVLLAFAVTGLSLFVRAYLRMFFAQPVVLNAVFFFLFSVGLGILFFPVELYEGFILERHFKLSAQSFLGWLKDYFKKGALTFLITLFIVECVYALLGPFSSAWWVFASLIWLVLTLFLTRVFPYFILPLFFKSRVLPEGSLKARLQRLAELFSFSLSAIYILELSAKTNKANAMVAGIGSTKRVYLSDTLLKDFSDEEIEIIVAHELVHNKNKDIYKHFLIAFLVSAFSFYLCDVFLGGAVAYFGYSAKNDIAALPFLLLLFVAAGVCAMPLQNGFSRRLEAAADKGAIEATANPQSFITMMKKLGAKNLAEFAPGRFVEMFLYDHPPLGRRIRMAEAMMRPAAGSASGKDYGTKP